MLDHCSIPLCCAECPAATLHGSHIKERTNAASAARSTCQLLPSAARHALQPTFTAATPRDHTTARPPPHHTHVRRAATLQSRHIKGRTAAADAACCPLLPSMHCSQPSQQPHQVDPHHCTPRTAPHPCADVQPPFKADTSRGVLRLPTLHAPLCCAACLAANLHSSHTKGPHHCTPTTAPHPCAARLPPFTAATSMSVLRLPALYARPVHRSPLLRNMPTGILHSTTTPSRAKQLHADHPSSHLCCHATTLPCRVTAATPRGVLRLLAMHAEPVHCFPLLRSMTCSCSSQQPHPKRTTACQPPLCSR
jgi:hypothetical protein